MDKIRSSVDLARAWARITNTAEKTALNRIRFLRDAWLMPNTHTIRKPLNAKHAAVFIVGMLGSATHDGAALAVRDYSMLKGCDVLEGSQTALSGFNIVDGLAAVLRNIRDGGETQCVSLTLCTTDLDAMLFLKRKGDEQITAAVRYIPPDVADVPRFKEDRTISGEVLHELAALLAPDRIAARAERQVSLGTMKAG